MFKERNVINCSMANQKFLRGNIRGGNNMAKKKFMCISTSGHTDDIEGVFKDKAKDREEIFEREEIGFGEQLACFEDTKKNRSKLRELLK